MAKKPSKIENKTQLSLCLQTGLQQNLRISTNHKYRIYMDVFLQPDVLKTWRFVGVPFKYLFQYDRSFKKHFFDVKFELYLCTNIRYFLWAGHSVSLDFSIWGTFVDFRLPHPPRIQGGEVPQHEWGVCCIKEQTHICHTTQVPADTHLPH
jgi:hypothetical protein